MGEQALLEVLKGSIALGNTTISAIVGALLTVLFLRKNTKTTEFEKIKSARFGEVVEELLTNGKMSYLEYYKCNNFLTIAKKADEIHRSNEMETKQEKQFDFDWFIRFYEYASCISNEDMQKIWASVFSREVTEPGRISLTLLNSLSLMTKTQAQSFCNISRFALRDVNYHPSLLLFISKNRQPYKNSRITPELLKELQRLGLVDCDFINEFVFFDKKEFISRNKVITVYGDPQNNNKIMAGNVIYTSEGEALYSIIDDSYKEYRSEIIDFTINRFKKRNCRVTVNGKEV